MRFKDLFETPEMMPGYSREKMDPRDYSHPVPVQGKWEHVSTSDSGHDFWKFEDDQGHGHKRVSMTATSKDGKRDMYVSGDVYGHSPKEFHVGNLEGYHGATMKAHDFYHHIVQHHYDLVSDNVQSWGSRKTWERLANRPGIALSVRRPVLDHQGKPMKNFTGGEVAIGPEDMHHHYSNTTNDGGPKNFSRFVARWKK